MASFANAHRLCQSEAVPRQSAHGGLAVISFLWLESLQVYKSKAVHGSSTMVSKSREGLSTYRNQGIPMKSSETLSMRLSLRRELSVVQFLVYFHFTPFPCESVCMSVPFTSALPPPLSLSHPSLSLSSSPSLFSSSFSLSLSLPQVFFFYINLHLPSSLLHSSPVSPGSVISLRCRCHHISFTTHRHTHNV